MAALSTNVCRLLFLAVEQAVEALLYPTLLILVLDDVTDRSLRPAVYMHKSIMHRSSNIYLFIYLFNPQLDTMQIRTYRGLRARTHQLRISRNGENRKTNFAQL